MRSYEFADWDEIKNKEKHRIASSILQAPNLRSLTIYHRFWACGDSFDVPKGIYSLLPFHIKHLVVPIDDLKQIKIILERCQYLISVKFTIGSLRDDLGIEKWFSENTINSTFVTGLKTVWIGQKKIVTDQVINKNQTN